jgi:diguanylate cyclase (GGDEF)-like protein/PAS domain S-box-containing protein
MGRSSASGASRRQTVWLRKYAFGLRLGTCFLFVNLTTLLVRSAFGSNLIWLSNGVLLSFLLLASRRRWPAYMAVGLVAQLTAYDLAKVSWQTNALLLVLNMLEVLIAALLLRRRSTAPPRFTDSNYLIRFAFFGVLAGPIVTGLAGAAISALWPGVSTGITTSHWIASDALGIVIATPVFVAILLARFRRSIAMGWNWLLPLVCVALTLTAFIRTGAPLVFVLFPLLALILVRMGMGWAVISMIFVAWAGGWATLRGLGPIYYLSLHTPLQASVLLQVLIASGVFMLYSVTVVLEREQAVIRRLEETASLLELVSQNSRDAIIVADLSGRRSYGSASAQHISGWKPEELMTEAGIELIHPDDRARAQAIMEELNTGTEGATIECRVRKEDGTYIWVEATLRVVKGQADGEPSRFLNIVRDISERKEAELKLQAAYQAVEALAVTDALTNLANRRRFDQYMATEWRRSARDRQPLSLIMMDVDKFKPYNDAYGHVRGDSCLKQIAEACMDVVSRPGDLVSRFGGEEFAVILPNTDNAGAMKVAQEICDAVSYRRLPHEGSSFGVVTISLGCATVVPKFGRHLHELLEAADAALYSAKEAGRNQVRSANELAREAAAKPQALDAPPAG